MTCGRSWDRRPENRAIFHPDQDKPGRGDATDFMTPWRARGHPGAIERIDERPLVRRVSATVQHAAHLEEADRDHAPAEYPGELGLDHLGGTQIAAVIDDERFLATRTRRGDRGLWAPTIEHPLG